MKPSERQNRKQLTLNTETIARLDLDTLGNIRGGVGGAEVAMWTQTDVKFTCGRNNV